MQPPLAIGQRAGWTPETICDVNKRKSLVLLGMISVYDIKVDLPFLYTDEGTTDSELNGSKHSPNSIYS
jgi:hypothetical protein